MRVPGTIDKHAPEHQAHVCRFLGIPLYEYEDWLANHNIVHWRKFNDFLMGLRDKIDESRKRDDHVSITLEEAMRLYGVEDSDLTPLQQQFLVESANGVLEKHDLNWFLENHDSLIDELEETFAKII